ncbi:hypothetical protein Fmac_023141 [Flemingia macrophylla]|uniref:LOB domain-containing protein n=1 Tax=Flemingia macrophylla TaxID=520843 RepID=A0ABD1LKU6_9FABA
MKLSCNGCRILRKGCNDDCILRPCLEWINSPEAQANATLFLAKFFGRTGLLNLLIAAPQHLGQGTNSLLYEACGRLVNPTYGSLGLFWTGEWAQCEAAVNAVLSGSQINGVASSNWRTLGGDHILSTCDIRHVPKVTNVRGKIGPKRAGPVNKPKSGVGSVVTTSLRKPNWERKRMRVMEASLVSPNKSNRVVEAELDLELTLGIRCQSTERNARIVVVCFLRNEEKRERRKAGKRSEASSRNVEDLRGKPRWQPINDENTLSNQLCMHAEKDGTHSFRRFLACATVAAPPSLSSVAFDRSSSTRPPHPAPTLKSPLPVNVSDNDQVQPPQRHRARPRHHLQCPVPHSQVLRPQRPQHTAVPGLHRVEPLVDQREGLLRRRFRVEEVEDREQELLRESLEREAAAKAARTIKASRQDKADIASDDAGDDFWGEIELPELIDDDCCWTCPSGSSWTSSCDIAAWPEVELLPPFMVRL